MLFQTAIVVIPYDSSNKVIEGFGVDLTQRYVEDKLGKEFWHLAKQRDEKIYKIVKKYAPPQKEKD